MQEHAHHHDESGRSHPHAPAAKDEKIHSYYQLLGLALKELLIEKGHPSTPGSARLIGPAVGTAGQRRKQVGCRARSVE